MMVRFLLTQFPVRLPRGMQRSKKNRQCIIRDRAIGSDDQAAVTPAGAPCTLQLQVRCHNSHIRPSCQRRFLPVTSSCCRDSREHRSFCLLSTYNEFLLPYISQQCSGEVPSLTARGGESPSVRPTILWRSVLLD